MVISTAFYSASKCPQNLISSTRIEHCRPTVRMLESDQIPLNPSSISREMSSIFTPSQRVARNFYKQDRALRSHLCSLNDSSTPFSSWNFNGVCPFLRGGKRDSRSMLGMAKLENRLNLEYHLGCLHSQIHLAVSSRRICCFNSKYDAH